MREFVLKHKFIIIGVFVLVGILIGGTYAWINIELLGSKTNKIIAGTLELELDESTCENIEILNATPVSDIDGMKQVACTFTLENTGNLTSSYKIYLDDKELGAGESRMSDSDVSYGLVKNNGTAVIELLSSIGSNPNRVLDSGILSVGSSNTYELRLWIDSDASVDAMGKVVYTNLRISGEVGDEEDLYPANPPELVGDMIPVIYDGTNWIKADVTNTGDSWYDYGSQMWANAVTVTETNRASYVSAAIGTVIPMDDINTMMVWIPRYSYTLGNTYGYQGYGGSTPSADTPGAFNIRFVDSSVTDLGSASYTGSTVDGWFTNSAFCWGNSCDDPTTRSNSENRELSGIWVAKFETSTTDVDCNNLIEVDDYSSDKSSCNQIFEPFIIPDNYAWMFTNLSNQYNSILTYMNGSNGSSIYGLTGIDYDAHLIKNTEWGSVAILSQSKYGKYGNVSYVSDKKVGISCTESYSNTTITGGNFYQETWDAPYVFYSYNQEHGLSTSTTGNIYGIYGMAGGAVESVMGNRKDIDGNYELSNSGFSSQLENKYFNIYDYNYSFILGDGSEFNDNHFLDGEYSGLGTPYWMTRGGIGDYSYGDIFTSFGTTGAGYVDFHEGGNYATSFRVALVP